MALGALLGHGHLLAAHQRQLVASRCVCCGQETAGLHSSRVTDASGAPSSPHPTAHRFNAGGATAHGLHRQQRLEAARHNLHSGGRSALCRAWPGHVYSAAAPQPALQQPGTHLDQVHVGRGSHPVPVLFRIHASRAAAPSALNDGLKLQSVCLARSHHAIMKVTAVAVTQPRSAAHISKCISCSCRWCTSSAAPR